MPDRPVSAAAQVQPIRRLGDDIGGELILDEGDAVAQLQLAFLEALHLDHVGAGRFLQRGDRGVEVAMLLLQARSCARSSRSSSFVIAALVAPGTPVARS